MNRSSSPTNHVNAAAASHGGVRAFDPLAFNANPNAAPLNAPTNSSYGGGYGGGGYDDEDDDDDADALTRAANGNGNGVNGSDAAMDQDGAAGPQASATSTAGQRRRPRNVQDQEPVPPVVDQVGERVREGFRDFLQTFTDSQDADGDAAPQGGEPTYIDQIYSLRDYGKTTLFVDFTHLLRHEEVLARAVADQYYRFLPYLRRSLLDLINVHIPGYMYLNAHVASTASSGLVPRDFTISFYNLGLVSGIRDLRTDKVGRLVSISGTVTRTSEVRPELLYGAFTCQLCKNTVRDVEQQFKYTEPPMCRIPGCNNRREWQLNVDQSRFSDWQKVRIQENANEIPTGSMPRSLDVILRSEIVERAKAGDKCVFTGSFIVVPDVSQLGVPGVNAQIQREAQGGGRAPEGLSNQGVTGLKSLGARDLTYKTAFLACMVQSTDSRTSSDVRGGDSAEEELDPNTLLDTLTEEEREELEAMVEADDIYGRLVQSIAPTVYGHDIVKKGILLQLMGGVHKQTPEGIHLRGDINICIVGDPSTSKSQFLKYVCGFLPRAVYTSGKASSAAGLTAAVVKDEETGDFTIEAGALMLADNGICAIDEFDKMDIADQVAIHEAMEQQTISIAKAGLQATLNARTSILAAANPVGGRYNRKQTLRANVAMSAPIMSRFDLFFVVLDECNEQVDMNIAQHIVNVHRFRDLAIAPEFSTEAIQRYIRYARTFQPKLTPEASDVLVEKYRLLREDDASNGGGGGGGGGGSGKNSYRITVRQLESMIRLSEAIARANCRSEITPAFVREAYALLRQSIIHVEQDDVALEEEEEEGEVAAAANQESLLGQEGGDDADGDDTAMMESFPRQQRSGTATSDRNGTPTPATQSATQQRRKITITYDRYLSLLSLLTTRVASLERTTLRGVPREDLIEWYLEQREGDIDTIEELERERTLCRKVVEKLVKEQYLLEMRETQEGVDEGMEGEMARDELAEGTDGGAEGGEGGQASAGSAAAAAQAGEQPLVLMVHPRIDVDNL